MDHRQRVLAPGLVVAVRPVLLRVRAAALLARLGRDDGGERVRHQVGELQRLHQVGVPDHRAVGDPDVRDLVRDPPHLLDALGQRLVGAEDRRVLLHRPLHRQPQLGGRDRPVGVAQPVEARPPPPRPTPRSAARSASARSTTWPALIAAARPKTTRSIRLFDPSRLAPWTLAQPASPTAISPGRMRSGFVLGRVQRLAPVVRRDAAHVVVHRRQHRDRLLGHVDAGEDLRQLADAGQPLGQRRGRQVVEVEVDVVLVAARRPGPRGSRSSCSARPRRGWRGPCRSGA